MTGLAVALAASAALGNAVGDLLQRHSARSQVSDPRRSLALLVSLLRHRRWLAGVALSLAALGVHVGALSLGELAAVQPVLVAEMPLAVLGSVLFGARPAARDWWAVAAMAVGLASFVSCLAPTGGDPLSVPGSLWAVATAVVAALLAALAISGWRAVGDRRAGLLSTAAGTGYGLTGALLAVVGQTLGEVGLAATLSSWQTYVALATGAASFYLLQNALAAGKLVAVEPGLTLANPLLAVVWGLVVFGEQARTGIALIGAVTGAALLVVGVVVLSRSPILDNHDTHRHDADPASAHDQKELSHDVL